MKATDRLASTDVRCTWYVEPCTQFAGTFEVVTGGLVSGLAIWKRHFWMRSLYGSVTSRLPNASTARSVGVKSFVADVSDPHWPQ